MPMYDDLPLDPSEKVHWQLTSYTETMKNTFHRNCWYNGTLRRIRWKLLFINNFLLLLFCFLLPVYCNSNLCSRSQFDVKRMKSIFIIDLGKKTLFRSYFWFCMQYFMRASIEFFLVNDILKRVIERKTMENCSTFSKEQPLMPVFLRSRVFPFLFVCLFVFWVCVDTSILLRICVECKCPFYADV